MNLAAHVCTVWSQTSFSNYLGSSLGEAENVVYEKQHVLPLLITEIFGNGKPSQSHAGTGARGLVHLSVHQRDLETENMFTPLHFCSKAPVAEMTLERINGIILNYLGGGILQVDDTRLDHFMVQIVSFTGSLPHTSKHGVTTMGFSHVVDQLHNQHSLSYTSTTKQTYTNVEEVQNKAFVDSRLRSKFMINPQNLQVTKVKLKMVRYLYKHGIIN